VKRWCAFFAALVLPAGAAAWADSVSPGPDAVAVTIYHQDGLETSELVDPRSASWVQDSGLAFITETREIDLPAGPSEIRFRGVASTMVPQTADIDGLPAGVLERNFDYDLLSPGSLLAKSIGQTVHLIRTDPKTGRRTEVVAIVRTGPDGAMLEIDGKLEALRCSGLPERLVFDKTPDGLTDTPTLAIRTNAPMAGHYRVRLSYIATGLNWTADYVARVHPGGRALDLSGWLTLANFGSTGFGRIPVFAVAGKLNLTGEDNPIHPTPVPFATQCWPTDFQWWIRRVILRARGDHEYYSASPVTVLSGSATETVVVTGSRVPDPRQLGDYKLYALPEPTDMPAHETKQVQFLDLHDIPFERLYRAWADPETASVDGPAKIILRLQNTAAGGLGKPLPQGQIAMTEPGPGGPPIFVGQSAIRDTPVGLPVEIMGGETFSVQVKQRIVEELKTRSGSATRVQRAFEFEIANNRPDATTFELWQYLGDDAKILSESRSHIVDRGSAIWRMALKPGERVEMRYRFERPF
jgi:hypothetical protein